MRNVSFFSHRVFSVSVVHSFTRRLVQSYPPPLSHALFSAVSFPPPPLFASQVQPGEGDKAALSDMRSLSGGERSFSTVCFVLSLWAIAEAPFRCLDEFDVYMVRAQDIPLYLVIRMNKYFFFFLTDNLVDISLTFESIVPFKIQCRFRSAITNVAHCMFSHGRVLAGFM